MRDRLSQIVDSTAEPAFAVDATGRIAAWNRAAARLLGRSRGEAVGRPCADVVCGRDRIGSPFCAGRCRLMDLARLEVPIESQALDLFHASGSTVRSEILSLAISGAGGPSIVHLLRPAGSLATPKGRSREAIDPKAVHARPPAAPATGRAPLQLTEREKQVLGLLAAGSPTRDIAASLHITPTTVRNHVQHLLVKLGAHSRLEAVARAFGRRLL